MLVEAFLRVHDRLGGIGLPVGELGLLAIVPLLYRQGYLASKVSARKWRVAKLICVESLVRSY